MRASDIADAVGGELFGRDTTVEGVAIDSRRIRGGELFVPIVAHRDGHDYIDAAVAAGAAAYLTAGPIAAATAVRVGDTAEALLALGRHARGRVADRVVGITGSVGKTSTKDLLTPVLNTTYRTAASELSFNNELGVPLTLVNARDGTEACIIEMGARNIGHIALLCDVARPTVGVVTTVAGAHLEQFGSLEEVANAKSELVAYLPPNGCAVLNADDPRVATMAGRTAARVLTFGRHAGDVRAIRVTVDEGLRPSFRLETPWGGGDVRLAARGAHQVGNALAAAAAALAVDVALDAVLVGLAGAEVSAMRMELRIGRGGLRVLNDAYNANPASMAAALDALAAMPARRRIAVLGTMAELGPTSAAEHATIARRAAEHGIRVVAIAEAAYGIEGPDAVGSIDAAVDRLGELGEGDAVLVKASRAVGLERLAARLLAEDETNSTQ